ncbi:hypothetical protein LAD77_30090 [Klebsiella pneumoniae]|nr:hypothetical protein [Klebsiella pneumoniae]
MAWVIRNYRCAKHAEGAGGFFKGIDALPLTGQSALFVDKKPVQPTTVTDVGGSATAGLPA